MNNAQSTNVDTVEIEKFGKVSAQWWDRNGEFKPLHDINPLRLQYVRSCAPLSGKRVLDVGCGGGLLSEAMAEAGAFVTGIDMGPEPLAAAGAHLQKSGLRIDYRQISVEDLSRSHNSAFDLITCMELLEHVPEPASVIRACKTLVKPGGDIVFATINRNFKAFVFAIIGAEYILRLLPRGTHRYDRLVKPAEIAAWAADEGLSVSDMTGLQYNPFTRRYFLSKNTDVNFFMHLRRDAISSNRRNIC